MQHDPVVIVGHVRHPTIVFDTVMKLEYTETKKSTRPLCNALYASIAKPGIFTPHHYMTFFKVIHRALPTNTRFQGSKLCRLGCGCTETFVHWFHCKHIFPIWRAMANILTALGCGQYNCNRELVFLTLKRLRNGARRLINRHMSRAGKR